MASSSTNLISSSSSGTESMSVGRGMPKVCRCGRHTLMRTSKTPQNPGRIFHACPLRNEGGNYHLFKWTDVAMVEEIDDLKEVVIDLKECIRDYDNEIKNLKAFVAGCEKELMSVKEVVHDVENELKQTVGEFQSVKNMILGVGLGVGLVVAIGLYYVVS